jgi:hypothetical protein
MEKSQKTLFSAQHEQLLLKYRVGCILRTHPIDPIVARDLLTHP